LDQPVEIPGVVHHAEHVAIGAPHRRGVGLKEMIRLALYDVEVFEGDSTRSRAWASRSAA